MSQPLSLLSEIKKLPSPLDFFSIFSHICISLFLISMNRTRGMYLRGTGPVLTTAMPVMRCVSFSFILTQSLSSCLINSPNISHCVSTVCLHFPKVKTPYDFKNTAGYSHRHSSSNFSCLRLNDLTTWCEESSLDAKFPLHNKIYSFNHSHLQVNRLASSSLRLRSC